MESNNSIEELIIRYLQNEIQEDELRVLDAWIHESDANKAHFFELKGLFDTRKEVAFLNHYSVERSWERMAGKLDAISGVSVKSKVLGKQFWLSFLRYAAIIVIAMGIGVGMNQWISNRLYAGDMEYNEIVVEKDGRANTLLLSDGSKIILNASTRFKYPTSFNGDERVVHLEGEAYFEVHKDSSRPFVVRMNGSEVTVLGTSFNVNTYGDDGQIYTTLVNGSVRVSSVKNGQAEVLKPGMQSVMDVQSGQLTVREVDVEPYVAWREGRFVFRAMTLDLIMRQLQRWYDFEVFYQNPELKDYEFRGVIKRDMDLDKVLSVIKVTTNVDFEVKGKVITIIKR